MGALEVVSNRLLDIRALKLLYQFFDVTDTLLRESERQLMNFSFHDQSFVILDLTFVNTKALHV